MTILQCTATLPHSDGDAVSVSILSIGLHWQETDMSWNAQGAPTAAL